MRKFLACLLTICMLFCLCACGNNSSRSKFKNIKEGDYIKFGKYEQDNNTDNGTEDIEWLVLEVKDGKALIISKYALDCLPFNTERTEVTWETCTLRKWLNNTFINSAFSAKEKAIIATVTAPADDNLDYSIPSVSATQDQVFVLNVTEAQNYFYSDNLRQCAPTAYAIVNGVRVNDSNNNCDWWLRTPSPSSTIGNASVRHKGSIDRTGHAVDYHKAGVRPALWIDLNES